MPTPPDDHRIIQQATREAAEKLGLTCKDVGEIIGMSRDALSSEPPSFTDKQLELCLLLLRASRSLFAIVGEDFANLSHWVRTENHALRGVPLELMKTVPGLVQTIQYLEASRERI